MKKYFYTISLLFFAVTLDAQEGELDPSFANVGYSFIRSANFSVINTGYAIAVQPDGKIVTAGPGRGLFNNGPVFMITRQLPNGAPDPAFGAGGIVYIDPVASDEDGQGTSAYGITVGADGKIVVVGSRVSWYDFSPSQYGTAIVQLHANGSLDNSFSGDGILILQLGATGTNVYEAARDVSLQADGKIVISGVAFDGVKNVMTVARILPAGILDPSFNGTGVVYPDFPLASEGLGVTIQANGAILSAGSATNIAGNKDYALVRLNANGTYDAGFDGDGKFTKDFSGGMDEATDVAIQADGKLILSGTAAMPAQTPTLVRLLANGNIDNSFDNDGIRPINIAPGNTGQSVVTQPDGKIIWLITTSNVYFVVKLNADGSPYPPFSFDGVGVYNYGGQGDAYDIALQADGRIVTSGFGSNALGTPGFPNVGRTVSRILNTAGPLPVTISCPSSLTVNTGFNGADHCTGLAPGLFAATVPESPYTYSTTGATVSSGSQSAGALFNLGLTTVTYTSVNDPSKSCSFTVTVVDSRAPTLNCTGEIRPCYSANQMYTIPPISATDNCGLSSVQYVITGATSRSGSGVNASGLFNTGTSTITWTATDASGNSSNCQIVVHINALSASVAGQLALSSGASPNTIYLGYGPQALTYSVQVTGGLPPYSYSWSNGSTSSTAAFSSAVVGIHPFTVTVTDDRGCSVVVSTQVEVMDVRCGNKNNQVSLCKGNGKGIICVAPAAVQSHLNNGAMLGSCSVSTARLQETLSEITSTLQVLVRPNPSVGRFGVFVQSENVVERIQLRILDLMGREMERMVVVPNTFFVIGERYGSGLYLLQVNQGQTQVVHKLVKME